MRPIRWLSAGAFVAVTTLLCAAGCSSGSGDLRDGSYAYDNGYDADALDPSASDSPPQTCTHDTVVSCGFEGVGTKICTCAGGVYTQCPCFPPRDWQGAITAPPCDALTATVTAMRGQSCTRLGGAQCVDRSVADPALQEGCKCVDNGNEQWACGPLSQLGIPTDAVSCLEFATGKEIYLKNKPCTNEWQECISRDFVDGTTQHGCVCLSVTGTLRWACGSTNKWFVPE